jgi:hypothetical protein
MKVTTASGAPTRGVQIFETDNVEGCIAPRPVGTTDGNGEVSMDLSPEMVGSMYLGREGVDGTRPLTGQELNDLVENGRVNVKLPPGSRLEGP